MYPCFPKVPYLPNDKILELTEMRAFADDKVNDAKMMIFFLDRVEKLWGKGKNAGYQHFILFLQCFPKHSSLLLLKVGIVW